MKTILKKLILLLPLLISCEEFLEIDLPKNQLVGESVFDEATTIDGTFSHLYASLRDNAITSGTFSGLSFLLGHYSDEMNYINETPSPNRNFFENNISPTDNTISVIWNSSYNLIYDNNRILEGLNNSKSLISLEKNRFLGEAYFVRAFVHFYLTNLFGEVPYIETTDYQVNSKAKKLNIEVVYENVIKDLIKAKELLHDTKSNVDSYRPNYWTVSALLARTYLYLGDWEKAKNEAIHVISNGPFELEQDLGEVFLKDSKETLWQLDSGGPGNNTKEGNMFIVTTTPPRYSELSQDFLNSFEEGDSRYTNWVGAISNETQTWHFPFKYKLKTFTEQATLECSILFRLSELYLIVAESSANLNQINEACDYLNIVRNRSSLPSLTITNQDELLKVILKERRIEYFSEQGHRFFDLKRTGKIDEVLSLVKPFWDDTDVLLPLPDGELLKNPNLLPQNDGY